MVVSRCPQSLGLPGSSLRAHETVEGGAGGRQGVGLIYFLERVSSPVVTMISPKPKQEHLGNEEIRNVN